MPGRGSAHPIDTSPFLPRLAWAVLLLGGGLTAVWVWSCWCSFPSNPWNDIRVAPAIALHHGFSVYQPAGQGPASTWAYGPLPLFVLWPAGFARSASGAIELAGAIHIAVRILTLVWVCLAWPAASSSTEINRDRQLRLAAALLCVLLVRNDTSGYAIFTSDSIGLSAGLLSLIALTRGHLWMAAGGAVAAVACKQTMIGIGAAQVIWLALAISPSAALRHCGRGAAVAIAAALGFVAMFGAAGLWHVMFKMPGIYPWAAVVDRIFSHPVYLLFHVVAPLIAIAARARFFHEKRSPVLLPTLAFLCTLPLSLAGFLKIGGNVNNLHSFWLWFPIVLVALTTTKRAARLGQASRLVLISIPALLASLWLQLSPVRVRPNVAHYHEAAELIRRMPGQVWFPMNPIVTLYGDHRLYHDFDGLRAWAGTGFRATDEHYLAYLPGRWKAMATLLPIGWGAADDARLPPNIRVAAFGSWRLDLLPDPATNGGR